jgi:hypothetical protein
VKPIISGYGHWPLTPSPALCSRDVMADELYKQFRRARRTLAFRINNNAKLAALQGIQ